MKNIIFRIAGMLFFALILSSCGSSQKTYVAENSPTPEKKVSHKPIKATAPQTRINTAPTEAEP